MSKIQFLNDFEEPDIEIEMNGGGFILSILHDNLHYHFDSQEVKALLTFLKKETTPPRLENV